MTSTSALAKNDSGVTPGERERVLITGVDGFTGRHLAPLLDAQGYEVHGLVTHAATLVVKGASRLHAGDLTDAAALAAIVVEVAPHRVVHLAGVAYVHGDAESMYAVNLVGTRKLLEALCASSTAPRSVLLASSANVYGNLTEGALDEETRPRPANDYAVSKLAMEHMAALYTARLPLVICRPFNYTGVGQSETFLLPKIVAHARQSAPFIELGNLDVARDFSDVRDVVVAYAGLLRSNEAIGRTVNVCSGQAFALREVLRLVQELSGWTPDVRVDPKLVRPNEIRMLKGDRSLLDALLPSLPRPFSLERTLAWMIHAPSV